ncbi:MAG: undecaprenyl-diphosphate phosphatase, partial [Erysipelotrichaceae bacterium]
MNLLEIIKVIVLGIVQGITEWLPISSTGHMILIDELMTLSASDEFKAMFFVVIQFGSILAVIVLFWKKIFPITFKPKLKIEKSIIILWTKIVLACIPAAVAGLLMDDFIDAIFYNWQTISITLIIYGVWFIVV